MINKYTYFDNLQYENISRRKEGSLLHLFLFRRTIYALMYTNQGETVYSNNVKLILAINLIFLRDGWRKRVNQQRWYVEREDTIENSIRSNIRIDEIYESGNPWNRRIRPRQRKRPCFTSFSVSSRGNEESSGCFCQEQISREDATPIQSERLLITCAIKLQNPRRTR